MKYILDPNKIIIPHDKERNYNDTLMDNYMPPYHHYRYNSIYEGIMLEIQITDHCNLNCANCNHFSPIANKWNISVEEFTSQLNLAKNNIPNIKTLILIGGEPTLHPDFPKLCKIAREIFPTIEDIQFHTNGTNVNILNKYAEIFKENNIHVCFCSYPGYSDNEKIEQFIQENQNSSYLNTRIFMNETLVDKNGTENFINNFYNCSHHSIPCLTIKNSKLYVCPFAAHIEHYCKKANCVIPEIEGIDYLLIKNIAGDIEKIQDFIFTPKPICGYCKHNSALNIWHKSFKDIVEYETTINELYFTDYDRYEQIINNSQYFLNCLDKNKNKAILRLNDCGDMGQKMLNRFGKGKIDIIIPYYNMPIPQLEQLYNTLINQTIIKDCVIYLISDNSPDEKIVLSKFENSYLNVVFLKNKERSGPGVTRNKGIDNSYNDYIFFLDADDYFSHNTALEELYKTVQNQYFICNFTVKSDRDSKTTKHTQIFDKKFLTMNNLKYPPYYFGEDFLFMISAFLKCPLDKLYTFSENKQFLIYGLKNNTTNLSSELITQNKDLTNFCYSFAFVKMAYMLNDNIERESEKIQECISNLHFNYLHSSSQNKVFIYYMLYKLYLKYPYYFNEDNISLNLLNDFINNSLSISNATNTFMGEKEILNYLLLELNQYSKYMLSEKIAIEAIELLNAIS